MTKNARLAANLAALVVGMVLLAYASVPLYRLFCQVTGYGGTTRESAHAPAQAVDRSIIVDFNADTDPHLRWQFRPGEKERKVRVGEQSLTYFVAKNLSDKPVVGRAVYNVLPYKAGPYFVKIACFCFEEQTLAPGQEVNMPVSFYLDPALMNDPEMNGVHRITLSYTFFPVKE